MQVAQTATAGFHARAHSHGGEKALRAGFYERNLALFRARLFSTRHATLDPLANLMNEIWTSSRWFKVQRHRANFSSSISAERWALVLWKDSEKDDEKKEVFSEKMCWEEDFLSCLYNVNKKRDLYFDNTCWSMKKSLSKKLISDFLFRLKCL